MQTVCVTFTVYFEDPFWVGVYERQWDGKLEVGKITFGAEPKEYEVYDVLLRGRDRLQMSLPVSAETGMTAVKVNPKRMQRQIQRQLQDRGIGTKAQQALKLQQEQGKLAHKVRSREAREAEQQRQFALHQEKRREKHRGH